MLQAAEMSPPQLQLFVSVCWGWKAVKASYGHAMEVAGGQLHACSHLSHGQGQQGVKGTV